MSHVSDQKSEQVQKDLLQSSLSSSSSSTTTADSTPITTPRKVKERKLSSQKRRKSMSDLPQANAEPSATPLKSKLAVRRNSKTPALSRSQKKQSVILYHNRKPEDLNAWAQELHTLEAKSRSKEQEQKIYCQLIRLAKHLNRSPEHQEQARELYRQVISLSSRFDERTQALFIEVKTKKEVKSFGVKKILEVTRELSKLFTDYFKKNEDVRGKLSSIWADKNSPLLTGLNSIDTESRNIALNVLFKDILPLLRIMALPAKINEAVQGLPSEPIKGCGINSPDEQFLLEKISQPANSIVRSARQDLMADAKAMAHNLAIEPKDGAKQHEITKQAHQERHALEVAWQTLALELTQIEALPTASLQEKLDVIAKFELAADKRKFELYADLIQKVRPHKEELWAANPHYNQLFSRLTGDKYNPEKDPDIFQQLKRLHDKIAIAEIDNQSYQQRIEKITLFSQVFKPAESNKNIQSDLQILRDKAEYIFRESQALIKQKCILLEQLQYELEKLTLTQEQREQYQLVLAEHFYLGLEQQNAKVESTANALQQEEAQYLLPLVECLGKATGINRFLPPINNPFSSPAHIDITPYCQVVLARKKLLMAERAVREALKELRQFESEAQSAVLPPKPPQRSDSKVEVAAPRRNSIFNLARRPSQSAVLPTLEQARAKLQAAEQAYTSYLAKTEKAFADMRENVRKAEEAKTVVVEIKATAIEAAEAKPKSVVGQLSPTKKPNKALERFERLRRESATEAASNQPIVEVTKPAEDAALELSRNHAVEVPVRLEEPARSPIKEVISISAIEAVQSIPVTFVETGLPTTSSQSSFIDPSLSTSQESQPVVLQDPTASLSSSTSFEPEQPAVDPLPVMLMAAMDSKALYPPVKKPDPQLLIAAVERAGNHLLSEQEREQARYDIYILLDQEVDPNFQRESDKWTPLHCAIKNQDTETVKLLLYVANPNIRNKDRLGALGFAESKRSGEMITLLRTKAKGLQFVTPRKKSLDTGGSQQMFVEQLQIIFHAISPGSKTVSPTLISAYKTEINAINSCLPINLPETSSILLRHNFLKTEVKKLIGALVGLAEAFNVDVEHNAVDQLEIVMQDLSQVLSLVRQTVVAMEKFDDFCKASNLNFVLDNMPSLSEQLQLLEGINSHIIHKIGLPKVREEFAEKQKIRAQCEAKQQQTVSIEEREGTLPELNPIPESLSSLSGHSGSFQAESKKISVLSPLNQLAMDCAKQLLEYFAVKIEQFPLNQTQLVENTFNISSNAKLPTVLDHLIRFFENQEKPTIIEITNLMLQAIDASIVIMIVASQQSVGPSDSNSQLQVMGNELLEHAVRMKPLVNSAGAEELHVAIVDILQTDLAYFLKVETKPSTALSSSSFPVQSRVAQVGSPPLNVKAFAKLQEWNRSPVKRILWPITEESADSMLPDSPSPIRSVVTPIQLTPQTSVPAVLLDDKALKTPIATLKTAPSPAMMALMAAKMLYNKNIKHIATQALDLADRELGMGSTPFAKTPEAKSLIAWKKNTLQVLAEVPLSQSEKTPQHKRVNITKQLLARRWQGLIIGAAPVEQKSARSILEPVLNQRGQRLASFLTDLRKPSLKAQRTINTVTGKKPSAATPDKKGIDTLLAAWADAIRIAGNDSAVLNEIQKFRQEIQNSFVVAQGIASNMRRCDNRLKTGAKWNMDLARVGGFLEKTLAKPEDKQNEVKEEKQHSVSAVQTAAVEKARLQIRFARKLLNYIQIIRQHYLEDSSLFGNNFSEKNEELSDAVRDLNVIVQSKNFDVAKMTLEMLRAMSCVLDIFAAPIKIQALADLQWHRYAAVCVYLEGLLDQMEEWETFGLFDSLALKRLYSKLYEGADIIIHKYIGINRQQRLQGENIKKKSTSIVYDLVKYVASIQESPLLSHIFSANSENVNKLTTELESGLENKWIGANELVSKIINLTSSLIETFADYSENTPAVCLVRHECNMVYAYLATLWDKMDALEDYIEDNDIDENLRLRSIELTEKLYRVRVTFHKIRSLLPLSPSKTSLTSPTVIAEDSKKSANNVRRSDSNRQNSNVLTDFQIKPARELLEYIASRKRYSTYQDARLGGIFSDKNEALVKSVQKLKACVENKQTSSYEIKFAMFCVVSIFAEAFAKLSDASTLSNPGWRQYVDAANQDIYNLVSCFDDFCDVNDDGWTVADNNLNEACFDLSNRCDTLWRLYFDLNEKFISEKVSSRISNADSLPSHSPHNLEQEGTSSRSQKTPEVIIKPVEILTDSTDGTLNFNSGVLLKQTPQSELNPLFAPSTSSLQIRENNNQITFPQTPSPIVPKAFSFSNVINTPEQLIDIDEMKAAEPSPNDGSSDTAFSSASPIVYKLLESGAGSTIKPTVLLKDTPDSHSGQAVRSLLPSTSSPLPKKCDEPTASPQDTSFSLSSIAECNDPLLARILAMPSPNNKQPVTSVQGTEAHTSSLNIAAIQAVVEENLHTPAKPVTDLNLAAEKSQLNSVPPARTASPVDEQKHESLTPAPPKAAVDLSELSDSNLPIDSIHSSPIVKKETSDESSASASPLTPKSSLFNAITGTPSPLRTPLAEQKTTLVTENSVAVNIVVETLSLGIKAATSPSEKEVNADAEQPSLEGVPVAQQAVPTEPQTEAHSTEHEAENIFNKPEPPQSPVQNILNYRFEPPTSPAPKPPVSPAQQPLLVTSPKSPAVQANAQLISPNPNPVATNDSPGILIFPSLENVTDIPTATAADQTSPSFPPEQSIAEQKNMPVAKNSPAAGTELQAYLLATQNTESPNEKKASIDDVEHLSSPATPVIQPTIFAAQDNLSPASDVNHQEQKNSSRNVSPDFCPATDSEVVDSKNAHSSFENLLLPVALLEANVSSQPSTPSSVTSSLGSISTSSERENGIKKALNDLAEANPPRIIEDEGSENDTARQLIFPSLTPTRSISPLSDRIIVSTPKQKVKETLVDSPRSIAVESDEQNKLEEVKARSPVTITFKAGESATETQELQAAQERAFLTLAEWQGWDKDVAKSLVKNCSGAFPGEMNGISCALLKAVHIVWGDKNKENPTALLLKAVQTEDFHAVELLLEVQKDTEKELDWQQLTDQTEQQVATSPSMLNIVAALESFRLTQRDLEQKLSGAAIASQQLSPLFDQHDNSFLSPIREGQTPVFPEIIDAKSKAGDLNSGSSSVQLPVERTPVKLDLMHATSVSSMPNSPPELSPATSPKNGESFPPTFSTKNFVELKASQMREDFRHRALSVVSQGSPPQNSRRSSVQSLLGREEYKASVPKTLFAMAAEGDLAGIQKFFSPSSVGAAADFDINACDAKGYTALMYAAANGHALVVAELLKQIKLRANNNVVEIAEAVNLQNSKQGDRSTLMLVVERFSTQREQEQGPNYLSTVSQLLEINGIEINQQYPDESKDTLLIRAIKLGKFSLVQRLLQEDNIDLTLEDAEKNTALMCAVQCQDPQLALHLVQILRPRSEYYENALLFAVRRGNAEIVAAFLRSSISEDVFTKALSEAVACKNIAVISQLRASAQSTTVDSDMFINAAKDSQWDVCHALLYNPSSKVIHQPFIDPEALNVGLCYAVNAADCSNQDSLYPIRVFRQLGANSTTALAMAIHQGNWELVIALLQPNPIGGLLGQAKPVVMNGDIRPSLKQLLQTTLFQMAVRGDLASIQAFFDRGYPFLNYFGVIQPANGTNAQSYLATNQDLATAIANGKDRNGHTALMYAIKRNDMEMVHWLLAIPGIDVNASNAVGYTALSVAIEKQNIAVIDLLLNAGAALHPPQPAVAAIPLNESKSRSRNERKQTSSLIPEVKTQTQASTIDIVERANLLLFAILSGRYFAAHRLVERGASLQGIDPNLLFPPAHSGAAEEQTALDLLMAALKNAHKVSAENLSFDHVEPPASRAATKSKLRKWGELVFWFFALTVIGFSVAAFSAFSFGLPVVLLAILPYVTVAFTALSSIMLRFTLMDDISSNWDQVFLDIYSEVEYENALRHAKTLAQQRRLPQRADYPQDDGGEAAYMAAIAAIDARPTPNDFIVLPKAPADNEQLTLDAAQREKLLNMVNSALNALMLKGEGKRIVTYPSNKRNDDIKQLQIMRDFLHSLEVEGDDGRNKVMVSAVLNHQDFRMAYKAFKGTAALTEERSGNDTILGRLRNTTLHPKTMMDRWLKVKDLIFSRPTGITDLTIKLVGVVIFISVSVLYLPLAGIERIWMWANSPTYATNHVRRSSISSIFKAFFGSRSSEQELFLSTPPHPQYRSVISPSPPEEDDLDEHEYDAIIAPYAEEGNGFAFPANVESVADDEDGEAEHEPMAVKNWQYYLKRFVKGLFIVAALVVVGLILFAITVLTLAMFDFGVGGYGSKLAEWILNNWEGSASDAAIRQTVHVIAPAIMGTVVGGGSLALVAISKAALRVNATSYNEFKPIRDKLLHDQEVRLQHFDIKGPIDFGWKNRILLWLSASTFGLSEVPFRILRPYRTTETLETGEERPVKPASLSLKDWWKMAKEYYNLFEPEGRRNFLRSFIKLFAFVFIITMASVVTLGGIALALTPVSWAIGGAIIAFYAAISAFKWWRNQQPVPVDHSMADSAPVPVVAADVVQPSSSPQLAPQPVPVDIVETKSNQLLDVKAALPESKHEVVAAPVLLAPQQPLPPLKAAVEEQLLIGPRQRSPSHAQGSSYFASQPNSPRSGGDQSKDIVRREGEGPGGAAVLPDEADREERANVELT